MKRISLAWVVFVMLLVLISSIQGHARELHDAAMNGDIVKARQLIEKGADVNAKDNYGKTALDMAEASHKPDIASILRAAVIR